MNQLRARRSLRKACLGMCLTMAVGLPSIVSAQPAAEFTLKAPAAAKTEPTAATPNIQDEGLLQKLRAMRAQSGGNVALSPPSPAPAPAAAPAPTEAPRGLFARFRQPPSVPPAPSASTTPPNQLTVEEMYKYASGLASPAEVIAAKIKADESGAKARLAAVQYLSEVDWRHYPEAEAAVIASLRADRNEAVRFEAAEALAKGQAISPKALEALKLTAMGSERDGNASEPSERVRAAALIALQKHWQGSRPQLPAVVPATTPTPQRLPNNLSKAPTPVAPSAPVAKAETPKSEPNLRLSSLVAPVPPKTEAPKPAAIQTAGATETKSSRWEAFGFGRKPNATGLSQQDKRKMRDEALNDQSLREFAETAGANPPAPDVAKAGKSAGLVPTLFGAKSDAKTAPDATGTKPAAPTAIPASPAPLAAPPAAAVSPPAEAPSSPPPPIPSGTLFGTSNGTPPPADPPLSSYRLAPLGPVPVPPPPPPPPLP